MALVKFNHMDQTPALTDIFENFLGRDLVDFRKQHRHRNVPAVNIYENNDEFRLDLAAPGLKKENFKINLDNNFLTISSEVQSSNEDKNTTCNRREFSYGSFQRTFTLPDTVDTEKISASYEDGVLSIHLAKKDEAKPKPVREIKIS